MAQSERSRGKKKNNLTIRYDQKMATQLHGLTYNNVSKYMTKYIRVYIRYKQHIHSTPKHNTEPQHKYCFGTLWNGQ